jgi:hypothetical protein
MKLTDEKGKEIELTTYQKNEIYRKAKEMKRELSEARLTKSEHWNATPENIKKFQQREGNPLFVKRMEQFRNNMRVIGADPSDIRVPEFRGQR